MRLLLAIFVALILVLSSCEDDTQESVINLVVFDSFLPVVNLDYVAPHPKAMAAWLHTPISDRFTYRSGNYYNYGACWRWTDSYFQSGGIPVIWSEVSGNGEIDFIGHVRRCMVDYRGVAKVLNEPDQPGQANDTPHEAAIIVHTVCEQLMTEALCIYPNAVDMTYLRKFIDAYIAEYGVVPEPYAWGIHAYNPYVFGTMTDHIDSACGILNDYGISCTNIWVTEYGTCVPSEMYEWTTTLVNDPRVAKFGVFTNRYWGCLNLVADDGTLTPIGESFVDALN